MSRVDPTDPTEYDEPPETRGSVDRAEFEQLLDQFAKAVEDAVLANERRTTNLHAALKAMNEAQAAVLKKVFP